MMTFKKHLISLALVLFAFNSLGAEEVQLSDKTDTKTEKPKAQLRDPAEFQKVIDEYKAYVAKIPPEIRDEIIEYRKEVAKLNKEKKLLFRKLSQSSQNYLKKEQQYKKRLPVNRKSLINIENPGQKQQKSAEDAK